MMAKMLSRCTLGLLVLCTLPGCSARRELNHNTELMLKALADDDYAAFEPIAHPDLRRHLPRRTFRVISRAFHHLGGLRDFSLTGLQLPSDGMTRGAYVLSFARGQAAMQVAYKDSEIRDVELGGRPLLDAMKAVRAEGFGKLGVLSFSWVGGKRSTFEAGQPLRYRLRVGGLGLDRQQRFSLLLSLLVMDSVGRVVLDQPRAAQQEGSVAAHQAPVATVEGALTLPRGGKHRVDFTVHDLKGGSTLEHSEVLTLLGQGPAEAAPDAGVDTGPDAKQ